MGAIHQEDRVFLHFLRRFFSVHVFAAILCRNKRLGYFLPSQPPERSHFFPFSALSLSLLPAFDVSSWHSLLRGALFAFCFFFSYLRHIRFRVALMHKITHTLFPLLKQKRADNVFIMAIIISFELSLGFLIRYEMAEQKPFFNARC